MHEEEPEDRDQGIYILSSLFNPGFLDIQLFKYLNPDRSLFTQLFNYFNPDSGFLDTQLVNDLNPNPGSLYTKLFNDLIWILGPAVY